MNVRGTRAIFVAAAVFVTLPATADVKREDKSLTFSSRKALEFLGPVIAQYGYLSDDEPQSPAKSARTPIKPGIRQADDADEIRPKSVSPKATDKTAPADAPSKKQPASHPRGTTDHPGIFTFFNFGTPLVKRTPPKSERTTDSDDDVMPTVPTFHALPKAATPTAIDSKTPPVLSIPNVNQPVAGPIMLDGKKSNDADKVASPPIVKLREQTGSASPWVEVPTNPWSVPKPACKVLELASRHFNRYTYAGNDKSVSVQLDVNLQMCLEEVSAEASQFTGQLKGAIKDIKKTVDSLTHRTCPDKKNNFSEGNAATSDAANYEIRLSNISVSSANTVNFALKRLTIETNVSATPCDPVPTPLAQYLPNAALSVLDFFGLGKASVDLLDKASIDLSDREFHFDIVLPLSIDAQSLVIKPDDVQVKFMGSTLLRQPTDSKAKVVSWAWDEMNADGRKDVRDKIISGVKETISKKLDVNNTDQQKAPLFFLSRQVPDLFRGKFQVKDMRVWSGDDAFNFDLSVVMILPRTEAESLLRPNVETLFAKGREYGLQ